MDLSKSADLFEFILNCYEEISNSSFSEIKPKPGCTDIANIFDIQLRLYNYSIFSSRLFSSKYNQCLSKKYFIGLVLQFIDSSLYSFQEIQHLFTSDNATARSFRSENYTLIILPQNSIFQQLNKNLELHLRKIKKYDPNEIQNYLNLRYLRFVKNNAEFTINESFIKCPSLEKKLLDNRLDLMFVPTYIDILNENENDIYKIFFDDADNKFTLEYKKNAFLLENSIDILRHIDFDILIGSEISVHPQSIDSISKLIRDEEIDESKLFLLGSTWKNNENKLILFDQNGFYLISQNKYNPYVYFRKDNEETYIEGINTKKPFAINLLHIESFGLLGFMVCSDLLSTKYIDTVVLQCGITNLIVSSSSESDDIFSPFSYLSSHYGVAIFACNTCSKKSTKPVKVLLPSKDGTKRHCITIERGCRKYNKCLKRKNGCFGVNLCLDLKKLYKIK